MKTAGLIALAVWALGACISMPIQDRIEAQAPSTIKRLFVDGKYGQVHLRVATPPEHVEETPALLLLHPSPYSSAFYLDFMAEMSKDRVVIAIDTPGFGDSDRPSDPPSIKDYAANVAITLTALGVDAPVDVLGYHTGTLIAAELAIAEPARVRRLVLPGVPYFTGESQTAAFETYAKPDALDSTGAHLQSKWAFTAGGLQYGISLEQAQAHFSDLAQAMPESGHAYYGVFSYPGETQFPKLTQPSLFIAPTGSLLAETKAAQAITPNSELIILSEYPHNVFDIGLPHMAELTREFLDRD